MQAPDSTWKNNEMQPHDTWMRIFIIDTTLSVSKILFESRPEPETIIEGHGCEVEIRHHYTSDA